LRREGKTHVSLPGRIGGENLGSEGRGTTCRATAGKGRKGTTGWQSSILSPEKTSGNI